MDVGWLEKAELKPTQPSLAGAWLSLAKIIRLRKRRISAQKTEFKSQEGNAVVEGGRKNERI